MTPALVRSVDADALLEGLVGLSLEEANLLRVLLDLFPVPSPRHVGTLLEAIGRVARNIPWFEVALGVPHLGDLVATICERIVVVHGRLDRVASAPSLTGGYLLGRSVIGKESIPVPGPEALRAALLVCAIRWRREGNPRQTALNDLGAAIREVTEHSRQGGGESPLLNYLIMLGAAQTLEEFVQASNALVSCDLDRLADAWARHFEPTLSEILAAIPPAPVSEPPEDPSGPTGTGDAEEIEDETLSAAIRRVLGGAGPGHLDLEPGEPLEEATTSSFVSSIPGSRPNRDAKNLADYVARQAIWSSNHLLLTNHADVLPLTQYQQVVRTLLEELAQEEMPPNLRLGMVGLLLQAVTGRTASTLPAIQVQSTDQARQEGECGLSLNSGHLELDVFWRLQARCEQEGTGFFEPKPELAHCFEPVAMSFRLPLAPDIVHVLKQHAGALEQLRGGDGLELEACLRQAVRHVAERTGFPLILGQVRRSFSVHFYEVSRDLAMTQLVSADTLGQSDAPLHYYAPRKLDVAQGYWSFLQCLLQINLPMPAGFNDFGRIGAASLLNGARAKNMVAASGGLLNAGIAGLLEQDRWREVHDAMVMHVACMFLIVAGHRPVDALFLLCLKNIHLGVNGGMALFRDKVHDPAHNPRFAALASCLVKQLHAYLAHLKGLAELKPALGQQVRHILEGRAPLLFGIDDSGNAKALLMATWRTTLPQEWTCLPLNWGRTWIRTRGVELGLSPEWAAVQLGHLEAVGYPFSNASPTVPEAAVSEIAVSLETMARKMGWRVRAGIPTTSMARDELHLPPLQRWNTLISNHEAGAREQMRQWRQWQEAGIAANREQAERDVLLHPVLMERGISQAFAKLADSGQVKALTREEAEALRDVLFEAAEHNVALGLARSRALRRVLKQVNKHLGIAGQEPGVLGIFRRPVDNAFIPGMAIAVRQVRALRGHAAELGAAAPGGWKDFPRACARVIYVLALFGFMEHPEQIEGVIRHREAYVGPAHLPDAILVPWGERPDQVIALRNLAAIALARLAKRYPGQPLPDRQTLGSALREFLPQWALQDSGTRTCDPLRLLCETVGVANRFELSPAVRFTLDPKKGSTCASLADQLALIDGDPVGTIAREESTEVEDMEHKRPMPSSRDDTGNARTQYLALCRMLPKMGKKLELPLTKVTVPAGQLFDTGTRLEVIAELDAFLEEARPEKNLRPIIRLLALWMRQMLVKGTPSRRNPAEVTISTYMTRIGGTLVECLGNSSLVDIDEVELEEIYLAAIRTGRSNWSQAASAVLEFHRCCQHHFDMPDVDMDEIRSYLRSDENIVDAKLILPQERLAILERAVHHAEFGAAGSLDKARYQREAAAALPIYAWGAARRSEVLGLRNSDTWFSAEGMGIRVRKNRSRRLKTPAARRTLLFDAIRHFGIDYSKQWLTIDSRRTQPWRRPLAFAFSPLEEPQSAEERGEIAKACLEAIRAVTTRSRERMHRFRHLVAFERIVPLYLTDGDAAWFSERFPNFVAVSSKPALLPRALMEQVIGLGHVDWRTTFRCYLHLPWLLRSRQDHDMASQHMNRREVAFSLGITLQAVDKITQQNKHLESRSAWMEHVCSRRSVPTSASEVSVVDGIPVSKWSARDLDALFQKSGRLGGLKSAVLVSGGTQADAEVIFRYARLMEKRMGRRLFEDDVRPDGGPLKQVRRIEQQLLESILDWIDQPDAEHRASAETMIKALVEIMSPTDRSGLEGDVSLLGEFSRVLDVVSHSGVVMSITSRNDGYATGKVVRRTVGYRKDDIHLNYVIKRAIVTAWISFSMQAHY